MTDTFDNYVNLDYWTIDAPQLPQELPLPVPLSSSNELDIASVSNSELFQYFLDGELNAINYDSAPSESLIEPLMAGGVIAPSDLLKSAATAQSLFSFTSPSTFDSPSVDGSLSDPDFDMQDVKQEPIDTAELLRGLDARLAAMTAASKAAQAQSDMNAAEFNIRELESIKEENSDEKTDGEDALVDPKKLTSKERRQLRNKISARNFRVRRKEYISTLESQLNVHQTEARDLREKLLASEIEKEKLRAENHILRANAANAAAELEQLRQSLNAMQLPHSTPLSPPIEPLKDNKSPKIRPSPPLSKPNLNKDVSINGTRPGFMDNSRILVSSLELPEWNLEKIFEEHRTRKEGLSEKPVAPAQGLLIKPEDTIMATVMVGMVVQALMDRLWWAMLERLASAPVGVQFD